MCLFSIIENNGFAMTEFISDSNFNELVVDTTLDNRNDEGVSSYLIFQEKNIIISADDT